LCPGLGQLVDGRAISGVFWFLLTVVGYFLLIVPGVILHILCIMDAAKRRP
jgi:hypothetical protein